MILSIDPSIGNVGFAVWSPDGNLLKYGLIKTSPKKNIASRLHEISSEIHEICSTNRIRTLVIEQPPYFTRKNTNVESLMKLSHAFGAIESAFYLSGGELAINVEPNSWKGRGTKKTQTQFLVKSIYHITGVRHDVYDAIGIGHWYFSALNIRKNKGLSHNEMPQMQQRIKGKGFANNQPQICCNKTQTMPTVRRNIHNNRKSGNQ